MSLNEFVKQLEALIPNIERIAPRLKSYYSDFCKEFTLVRKLNQITVSNDIEDFIFNYNVEFLRFHNLFFSGAGDEFGENLFELASMDGLVLLYDSGTRGIYYKYSDENGIEDVFCENSSQLFQLFLILAEFSSLNLCDVDLNKQAYISRMERIYPLMDYSVFF